MVSTYRSSNPRSTAFEPSTPIITTPVPMRVFFRIIWHLLILACNVYSTEEFEDINGVMLTHISKRNRQHNDQMKKYKRTNNDLQNIHIILKIDPHLKPGISSFCSTSGTCRVILDINLGTSHEWGKEREVFTSDGGDVKLPKWCDCSQIVAYSREVRYSQDAP